MDLSTSFEKEGEILSLEEFEKKTGASFIPRLVFEEKSIEKKLLKKGESLFQKGNIPRSQRWLGCYFRKEIQGNLHPELQIRWIDPILGWGVFAKKPIKKMEWIAEYTGVIGKRRKEDDANPYCFEYCFTEEEPSLYRINALEQGGISRYLNHSAHPNLFSALAFLDGLSRVVFYTKEPVAEGEQLCYDYGPDYWSQRTLPIFL